MRHETFGQGRSALVFAQQKLNLHEHGREFEPKDPLKKAASDGSARQNNANWRSLRVVNEHCEHCFNTAISSAVLFQRVPKAKTPMPGAIDLCLITQWSNEALLKHLAEQGVAVEEGPVMHTGANGPIESVYARDPDANLIEISHYC